MFLQFKALFPLALVGVHAIQGACRDPLRLTLSQTFKDSYMPTKFSEYRAFGAKQALTATPASQ
jgi:hypothetical protein